MKWFLNINGKETPVDFNTGVTEIKNAIREFINEHSNNEYLGFLDNNILVSDDNIDFRDIIQTCFDSFSLENNDARGRLNGILECKTILETFPNGLTFYLNREEDRLPADIHICKGENALFTNCFFFNELSESVYYFEANFNELLGFFSESKKHFTAYLYTEEAKLASQLANRESYRFKSKYNIPYLDAIVSLADPNAIYSVGTAYLPESKTHFIDEKTKSLYKAISIFQRCYYKIINSGEDFNSNNLLGYLCYDIGQAFAKLKKPIGEMKWYRKGSNLYGDEECACELGKMFRKERNFDSALEYFEKAGRHGYIEIGNYHILKKDYDPNQYETALEYFKKSLITEGFYDYRCDFQLGLCHFKLGHYEEAQYWLERAYHNINLNQDERMGASLWLGILYLDSLDFEANSHIILSYLGETYTALVDRDISKRSKWYRLIAKNLFFALEDYRNKSRNVDEEEYCVGTSMYARMVLWGIGRPKDPRYAFSLMRELYDQNTDNLIVLDLLEQMYRDGYGVEANVEMADRIRARLYELADEMNEEDIEDN